MSEKGSPQRRRFLAGSASAAAHLMVLGVLLWPRAAPHPPQAKPLPSLILVSLPPMPPDAAAASSGVQTIVPPPLPQVTAPVLTIAAKPGTSDLLSDSQLAGAAGAGESPNGGGGGGCDTARAVQQSLRRDPLVRTAVEDAHRLGAAILLWNGDWVQSGGQDGKGLSAVREAIMWEVAFAPEACRNARMHGLVVLSLADGSTRFAIGSGDWRWSDLLGVR